MLPDKTYMYINMFKYICKYVYPNYCLLLHNKSDGIKNRTFTNMLSVYYNATGNELIKKITTNKY